MGAKKVSDATKWQIIGLKNGGNHSNVAIAKLVGVSDKCVRTTVKNMFLRNSVKDAPRSGRPPKMSNREKSVLFWERFLSSLQSTIHN